MTTTLLLDTPVLIWLTQEPANLGADAVAAINDPRNALMVSHASLWEIHLKVRSGRIVLPEPARQWIPRQLAAWKAGQREITLAAIQRAADLPYIHDDPIDRLLIAQALEENWNLVSPDPRFSKYGVSVIW